MKYLIVIFSHCVWSLRMYVLCLHRDCIYIFVYVCFVLCLHGDWLCGLTWGKFYVWEEIWNVNLLMTEFDCPEVILCGWQDVKIQLLTHSLQYAGPGIMYLSRCIIISRWIRCWSNVFAVIVVQLPDYIAASYRIEYWSIVFAMRSIWTMSSEMYSSDVEN